MPLLDRLLFPLTLASALGSGLIAGVFFAFSTFVMRALARLPAPEATAAMQSINIVVLNPLFLGVFMGTALTSAATLLTALLHWNRPGSGYLAAAALLYLLGTFLVTILFNVPLNDALAPLSPAAPDTEAHWANYLSRWTLWNHVRAAASLLALAAFILALRSAAALPLEKP